MKYIKHLEEIAKTVPNFPYEGLEVDYKDEGIITIVSLYWVDSEGNTKSEEITKTPSNCFHKWVYGRRAYTIVMKVTTNVAKGVNKPTTRKYSRASTQDIVHTVTGETVSLYNIKAFCRERELPYDAIKKLVQGRTKVSHGWTKVTY